MAALLTTTTGICILNRPGLAEPLAIGDRSTLSPVNTATYLSCFQADPRSGQLTYPRIVSPVMPSDKPPWSHYSFYRAGTIERARWTDENNGMTDFLRAGCLILRDFEKIPELSSVGAKHGRIPLLENGVWSLLKRDCSGPGPMKFNERHQREHGRIALTSADGQMVYLNLKPTLIHYPLDCSFGWVSKNALVQQTLDYHTEEGFSYLTTGLYYMEFWGPALDGLKTSLGLAPQTSLLDLALSVAERVYFSGQYQPEEMGTLSITQKWLLWNRKISLRPESHQRLTPQKALDQNTVDINITSEKYAVSYGEESSTLVRISSHRRGPQGEPGLSISLRQPVEQRSTRQFMPLKEALYNDLWLSAMEIIRQEVREATP